MENPHDHARQHEHAPAHFGRAFAIGISRMAVAGSGDEPGDHNDAVEVEADLTGLPGVTAVHDLHIWGMSTTEAALTVHLVTPDASIDDALLALSSGMIRP